METDLDVVVDRVADHTASRAMESQDWQKAVAINGLLAVGRERAARDFVDRSVATQTSAGYLSYGSHDPVPPSVLDPAEWPDYDRGQWQCHGAAIGQSVLECYDRTGDDRYLDAARKQYEALRDAVRTDDGGISYNSVLPELWVDSLYMVPPFFARYGQVTDTPAAFTEAVEHVTVQMAHLQETDTGLFRHIWRETPDSYPESTFWSRGNGWALTGILETLAVLPADHEGAGRLRAAFRTLADSLLDRQDASGFWRNVLDDPASPLETSGTLMFAYAFERGLEMGLLDDVAYRTAANQAMDVCAGVVDDTGRVQRVALPPGGPGVRLGDTSYGQGWFLLAADRFR